MRQWRSFSLAFAFLLLSWSSSLVSPVKTFAAVASPLAITREDVFFVPAPVMREVEVIQVLRFQNLGDHTEDVHVNLPSGAKTIALNGAATKPVDATGVLTLPGLAKPKATTPITVSYILDMDSAMQALGLNLHTDYPIYVARLYLAVGNTALSAPGILASTQTVTVSGTEFRVFTRPGIPAGDTWSLSLQTLPSTTTPTAVQGLPVIGGDQNSRGNMVEAVGNLVIIVFVLVVGLLSIRSSTLPRTRMTDTERKEALWQAWERLELQRRRNEIADDDYRRIRNDIKSRLVHWSSSGESAHD